MNGWIDGAVQSLPAMGWQIVRLTVWLMLLSALFIPLERRWGRRIGPAQRTERGNDLGYYFLNGLLLTAALHLPAALVIAGVSALVPAALTQAVQALPTLGKLLLALLVGEIGAYVGHRLSHQVPLLWRFHAVHHSATRMDHLVNTRAHPLDMMFTRLCAVALLAAVGLAGPSVGGTALPIAVVLIGTLWSFFVHADLRWRFGALEQLVATPAFHHWHHNRDENPHCNYAPLLPFIDRLFGTLYLPDRWPAAYGTTTPVAATFGAQLVDPFTPGPADARRASAGLTPKPLPEPLPEPPPEPTQAPRC